MKNKLQKIIALIVIGAFLFAGWLHIKEQRFADSAQPSAPSDTSILPPSQDIELPDNTASEYPKSDEAKTEKIDKNGTYSTKNEVALYIHTYNKLPSNFITKKQAEALGWDNKEGNLDEVAPGKSIGGSHFGNYENQLPDKSGRSWKECDINFDGGYRGAERILFSNDGLIYYTGDHYKTFEQLY